MFLPLLPALGVLPAIAGALQMAAFVRAAHLFTGAQAGSVGIIGGADGPTAILVASVTAQPPAIGAALSLAWKGMLGIFLVMVLIALVVWALTKLTSGGNKPQ